MGSIVYRIIEARKRKGEGSRMKDSDRFGKFDYIIVRIVLAFLLVSGALKVTWPVMLEVRQMLFK